MNDIDAIERQRSLAHMKNPDAWMHWPNCPLKRRDYVKHTVELGMLREVGDDQYQFHEGFLTTGVEAKWVDVTPDELIEQGWVMD